jgi:hypothetical protein
MVGVSRGAKLQRASTICNQPMLIAIARSDLSEKMLGGLRQVGRRDRMFASRCGHGALILEATTRSKQDGTRPSRRHKTQRLRR